jgi:large subunit ribosomal protein L18
MKTLQQKNARRTRRKRHVRKRISGTSERPRISIYKSNKNLYVQVIDDLDGNTLVSVSSQAGETKGLKPTVKDGAKLGEALGKMMKAKKISRAVFDRNGYLYHGVVKAVADGARKAGIEF